VGQQDPRTLLTELLGSTEPQLENTGLISHISHIPCPPWITLVTGSGENSVSVVCFDSSLTQWHCATIPSWVTTEDCRRWRSSASPVCCHVDTDCTINTSFNSWWPRLPGGGCSCMECSIIDDQSSDVTAVVAGIWRQLCSRPPLLTDSVLW